MEVMVGLVEVRARRQFRIWPLLTLTLQRSTDADASE